MKRLIFITVLILMAYGISIGAPTIQAQPYPNRNIQLVIPLVPGSALDINGRLFAEELGKILGAQVVVTNKPGASLTLGTDAVARSKKDGYTIAYTNTSAIVYARVLSPEIVPYDPVKDLEPLGLHCFFPLVGAVQESSPWKNFAELIVYAKKNPGKIRVATHGQGSIDHFNMEIIQSLTGAQFTHIPFKGGESVLTALLGGHVEVIYHAFSQVIPHVDAGKLRILLSFEPSTMMGLDPSIPTVESVFGKDLGDIDVPFSVVAPAKTPEETIKILEQTLEKVVKDPEFMSTVKRIYLIPSFVDGKTVMEKQLPDKMTKIKAILKKVGMIK